MKPFRILIFFMAVFALLLGISFLVPKDGIVLSEDIRIRFIHPPDLLLKDTVQYASIIDSIDVSNIAEDPESVGESVITILIDTIKKSKINTVAVANIDSLKKTVYKLELSENGRELLHDFFVATDHVKDGKRDRIRILHYGDSQIESDRMTSLIRFRLQEQFGGYGCGLVPAVPLYAGNPAYSEVSSGDFKRFTVFGKRDTTLTHKSYGVLGCFTSLPPSGNTSLPALKFNFYPGRRAGKFDRIKLYLHSYSDSSSIVVQVNNSKADTLQFLEGGYSVINYNPDTIVKKLSLEFDFLEGGRLYGISFESLRGVQMDNIAMRGSSGLVFSKMDRMVFEEMLGDLTVGLVILQFGGNVVPYIHDAGYYKRVFMREMEYLKEVCPNTPIIVLGPADMSAKKGGNFVTHSALVPVRDALREASLESGLAFWDLYQAMGGYNSMPTFVYSDPPLARPDYIHFTARGANLMAEMFYNALMLEYSNYKSLASEQSAVASNQSAISSRQSAVGSQQRKVGSRKSAAKSQSVQSVTKPSL